MRLRTALESGLFARTSRWPGAGGPRPSTLLALLGLCLAVTTLGLVASAAQGAVRAAGPVDELAAARASVTVRGVVVSDPVVRSMPVANPDGPAEGGGTAAAVGEGGDGSDAPTTDLTAGQQVVFRLRVLEVVGRGYRAATSTPVQVRADGRWAAVSWHDEVVVQGRLASPPPGRPVVAALSARSAPEVVSRAGVVERAAEHLRVGLREAVEPLPADARGLLPALVIGDTSGTPPDLTEAMLATGMTHLSAVSGSNVAIVIAAALILGRGLALPRRLRPALALLVLAGFVVLARPEPSVIRAAVMGGIGLIGLSSSRRGAGMPVLAGAIVVLLVVDPWLSRSYGFALSSLATLGLLLFVRPWGQSIGRRLPRRIASWGPAIAIPVAAQVMCAPVVVLLQGSVSVVGVVANLLAAPLVAPATILGVATALAGVVSVRLATLLAWLGALPTLGIARVARFFAAVPGGTAPWPDGAPGAVLLAVLTVGVLLTGRWLAHVVGNRPVAAFTVSVLGVASAAPTGPVLWPPPGWQVVVCDVGQGDAIVVATGPSRAVLVDAGPDPPLVDRCLRRLAIETLDAVVLTHFHADHVDGLAGALARRQVTEILTSPVGEPSHQATEVARLAGARGIPVHPVGAGDRLRFGPVTAEVWWPARRLDEGSVPNNASVVLSVHRDELDVLLLADVEREAARQLLLGLRRDPVRAAVLGRLDAVKAPHHGSANLDEDFMAAVRAPVGLISVGADNDYGHPAGKALEVLRRNGYAVYRTDRNGDVALVPRGEEVAVAVSRR